MEGGWGMACREADQKPKSRERAGRDRDGAGKSQRVSLSQARTVELRSVIPSRRQAAVAFAPLLLEVKCGLNAAIRQPSSLAALLERIVDRA